MPAGRLEEARAVFVELFPEGFEERDGGGAVELAAYAGAVGERRLRARFGSVEARPVDPGWEDGWRAFHRSVRVGLLWVGPPWERPDPDAVPVVIDPGRAFGTGAHPTTRLCLELLLEQEPREGLADLGCGSGVLAVAAAALGFAPVVAIDADPAAVEATRANAARNGARVETRPGDVLRDPLPEPALAVANLDAGTLAALGARLRCRRLIASGYLAGEAVELSGFRRRRRREADGWAAELFEREQPAR